MSRIEKLLNPLRIELLPSSVRAGVPLFMPFGSGARKNAGNIPGADKSLGNGLSYDLAVDEWTNGRDLGCSRRNEK